VRRWHDTPPDLRWPTAALVSFTVGGYSRATILAAAAAISLLMLVLLIAVVALGASFSRSPTRRRACMKALEALIRLAPWTARGDGRHTWPCQYRRSARLTCRDDRAPYTDRSG
jgi:hypothetical protein